ncbi:hypothetical protein [Desulfurobacterium atlanticum]|uniref:Uncharacterized protein n=1 Tax=Desulfurobacterium atlanticum TaxID=240169 RepID=A0A239A7M2_9BACT|nr:hypothetical protein [Desulfurobacterium atlanticum]SNR90883.1 hypothetical protein SAMN06265340_11541 [Desulfurobacterium atlanticum]
MRIELARAGNWNGQILKKEHLKQVAKNFKDEVPIVLGHLKADHMPAFGWIKSVELSDILKEAYDLGFIKSGQ